MTLTLVSDEEMGGTKGTKYLLDRGYIAPEYVVIGEQTDNHVAIMERGMVWLNVKTIGKAAHASTPWDGINAIEKMTIFLSMIQDELSPLLMKATHSMTPPPSINVGTIKGGVKTNVVPDMCEVNIDRRLLPEETPEYAYKLAS